MHRFFQTDDVILLVIDKLGIVSLLALRLVARSLYRLISSYQSSIVRRITKNLCEAAEYKNSTTPVIPLQRDVLVSVEGLRTASQLRRAGWLAVSAVAANRQAPFSELDGDMVRECLRVVQNGLMVLSALSRIHKQIRSESINSATKTPRRWSLRNKHFRIYETVAEELDRQWSQYMRALPLETMIDFNIAISCIYAKHAKGVKPWMSSRAFMYRLLQEGFPLLEVLWPLGDHLSRQRRLNESIAALADQPKKLARCDKSMWVRFWHGHTRAIDDELETAHDASWYTDSPFKFHISPGFYGATLEQLVTLRRSLVGEQALCCYIGG
ncbi:MAG: hypothetical protein Q9186_007120 [Xanthomendoza sp. 1 TL-2023]